MQGRIMTRLVKSKFFIRFLYHFVRLYSRTFSITVENEKTWRNHADAGGKVLLCCWHQHFFSFIRYFQEYRCYSPSIMISQSSDGELIAGIARLSGWQTIRGSSSREGAKALRQMIRKLRSATLAAHIVDGPRGPAGFVKDGVVHMAKLTGASIVPAYAIPERAWYFNSWDQFCLPKPFSKVTLRFGDMISIEDASSDKLFEEQRQRLESIMLTTCRPTRKPSRTMAAPMREGPADILPVNTPEPSVAAPPCPLPHLTSSPSHTP